MTVPEFLTTQNAATNICVLAWWCPYVSFSRILRWGNARVWQLPRKTGSLLILDTAKFLSGSVFLLLPSARAQCPSPSQSFLTPSHAAAAQSGLLLKSLQIVNTSQITCNFHLLKMEFVDGSLFLWFLNNLGEEKMLIYNSYIGSRNLDKLLEGIIYLGTKSLSIQAEVFPVLVKSVCS